MTRTISVPRLAFVGGLFLYFVVAGGWLAPSLRAGGIHVFVLPAADGASAEFDDFAARWGRPGAWTSANGAANAGATELGANGDVWRAEDLIVESGNPSDHRPDDPSQSAEAAGWVAARGRVRVLSRGEIISGQLGQQSARLFLALNRRGEAIWRAYAPEWLAVVRGEFAFSSFFAASPAPAVPENEMETLCACHRWAAMNDSRWASGAALREKSDNGRLPPNLSWLAGNRRVVRGAAQGVPALHAPAFDAARGGSLAGRAAASKGFDERNPARKMESIGNHPAGIDRYWWMDAFSFDPATGGAAWARWFYSWPEALKTWENGVSHWFNIPRPRLAHGEGNGSK